MIPEKKQMSPRFSSGTGKVLFQDTEPMSGDSFRYQTPERAAKNGIDYQNSGVRTTAASLSEDKRDRGGFSIRKREINLRASDDFELAERLSRRSTYELEDPRWRNILKDGITRKGNTKLFMIIRNGLEESCFMAPSNTESPVKVIPKQFQGEPPAIDAEEEKITENGEKLQILINSNLSLFNSLL